MKKRPSTTDHDLLIRIDERQTAHTELLNSILEEAKKTNGRVKALEAIVPPLAKDFEEVKPKVETASDFISRFKGAWRSAAVIGSISGALIALLGQLLFK